jgi:pimeloyl-ACP methyl ester carboxylesterase
VLGISMGGRIAIAFALMHPERVKSLILVSMSAKVIPLSWLSRMLFALVRFPTVRKMGTKHAQPYYAFVRQNEASRNFDATTRLHEIRIPTLILHGKKDRFTPFALAEEMNRGISGSEMVAFNSGHLFLFSRPKRFLD